MRGSSVSRPRETDPVSDETLRRLQRSLAPADLERLLASWYTTLSNDSRNRVAAKVQMHERRCLTYHGFVIKEMTNEHLTMLLESLPTRAEHLWGFAPRSVQSVYEECVRRGIIVSDNPERYEI